MRTAFCLASLPLLATPALADADPHARRAITPDARRAITVVATGLDLALERSGQSISVIDAGEIAAVQGPDLARVLERLPGVTLSRNGGVGGFTGLRVRGADAEQLVVLVDGVRMNDFAAPAAGYDFGNLLSGEVERIELLRGSNSVIWGSQAIGGVLAIRTREVQGLEASAEYGARDSFDSQVNAGLSTDRYGLALNGGYTRTDGVSAAAVGNEPDGFRQWRIGGRGRVALAERLSLLANARYADSRLELDGFPPGSFTFDDTAEYQKTREASGRAALEYAGDALSLAAGYTITDIRRSYFDPTFSNDPSFVTKGRGERAEMFGAWTILPELRLDFGADNERTRIETGGLRRKARLSHGHGLLGWRTERLSLAAGVRIDDHSRFGSEWTFGANGSYRIAGEWRLRASYGEGFKVPTLYQLFSEFGNPELVPEKSRSVDAGIEFGNRNSPLHLAVTGFRRDSRQLVDFVSCFSVSDPLCADGRFGFYANVGRARADGFEVELGARVSERLRAQAAYSYVKATNRTPGHINRGNDLARRPRHAVTVSADWISPFRELTLGGDIRVVGDSFDNAANTVPIDGYALVTLRASLPLGEGLELYGRIENLTDAAYETAAGYGTAGRSGFIGVRTRF